MGLCIFLVIKPLAKSIQLGISWGDSLGILLFDRVGNSMLAAVVANFPKRVEFARITLVWGSRAMTFETLRGR
jgi:hypothetical protein